MLKYIFNIFFLYLLCIDAKASENVQWLQADNDVLAAEQGLSVANLRTIRIKGNQVQLGIQFVIPQSVGRQVNSLELDVENNDPALRKLLGESANVFITQSASGFVPILFGQIILDQGDKIQIEFDPSQTRLPAQALQYYRDFEQLNALLSTRQMALKRRGDQFLWNHRGELLQFQNTDNIIIQNRSRIASFLSVSWLQHHKNIEAYLLENREFFTNGELFAPKCKLASMRNELALLDAKQHQDFDEMLGFTNDNKSLSLEDIFQKLDLGPFDYSAPKFIALREYQRKNATSLKNYRRDYYEALMNYDAYIQDNYQEQPSIKTLVDPCLAKPKSVN